MNKQDQVPEERPKDPTITYEGKKYIFKTRDILIFVIAAPIYIVILYALLEYAFWLRYIVAEHTIDSLNFVTGMGATMRVPGYANYSELLHSVGIGKILFSHESEITILLDIPGTPQDIQFVTFCTGFQAIIIFSAFIFFTPASTDKDARKGIWKRRFYSLFWTSFIFYVVNIIRMWIQLGLYYLGFKWEDLHYSISAASSFIAVIIILLMHKSLPEFVLSIVWTGIKIKETYFPKLAYKKPKQVAGKENKNGE
ncbi:MAG: archaeosortase H [Candidatus Hodarchaeota archaeon]